MKRGLILIHRSNARRAPCNSSLHELHDRHHVRAMHRRHDGRTDRRLFVISHQQISNDSSHVTRTKGVAVLIECGFISNKAEAARCATTSHRQKLAEGIAQGILRAM